MEVQKEVLNRMEKAEEKRRVKGILSAAICFLLFQAGAAYCGQAGQHSFNARIVDINLKDKTITVENEPYAYTLTLRYDKLTGYDCRREVKFDELPTDKVLDFWGSLRENNSVMQVVGIIERKAEPIPGIMASNHVCGKLFKEGESIFIDTGKKRIKMMTIDPYNFCASVEGTGSLSDLHKEMECRVTFTTEGKKTMLARLFYVVELLNKPKKPADPPQGISAGEIRQTFIRIHDIYEKNRERLEQLMPVTMEVEYRLAKVGESVRLKMTVQAEHEPNPVLELYPRFFAAAMKQKKEIKLKWKEDSLRRSGLRVFHALTELPSDKAGSYLLHWKCDIGGDIPEFWRYYSVIDEETAVCMFVVTNPSASAHPAPDFNRLHIPYDEWMKGAIMLKDVLKSDMAQWAAWSRGHREYGTDYNPHLWGSGWVLQSPKSVQANMQVEPCDVQRAILEGYRNMFPLMGFGAVDEITCYTMGSTFVRLAREVGYKTISAICSEQNFQDGPMQINHLGALDRPYFISKEDMRKAGDGGPEGLVGIGQVQRHPFLCRDYWCGFCIEPAWVEAGECRGGGRIEVDKVYESRIFDFFNAMLQNRMSQNGPYFFSVGIEFDGKIPGAHEGNQLLIEYAAQKAATEPLVFSTGPAVTDYYRRHFKKTPESSTYLQDYYCGLRGHGDKPVNYPDTLMLEGAEFKSMMRFSEVLPVYHYDFGQKWDYPDWGNEQFPRYKGYLCPGTYDPYKVVPKITDTRGLKVNRSDRETSSGVEVNVSVESNMSQKNMCLALWNIPCEWKEGEDWWKIQGEARFVPVRAPYTGNLNGVLVVDLEPGMNQFKVTFKCAYHEPETIDFKMGEHVEGKVFTRDGRTMAYLWPTLPWGATVELNLPKGKSAKVYVAPKGKEKECNTGKNIFVMGEDGWMRVVGLSRDELIKWGCSP